MKGWNRYHAQPRRSGLNDEDHAYVEKALGLAGEAIDIHGATLRMTAAMPGTPLDGIRVALDGLRLGLQALDDIRPILVTRPGQEQRLRDVDGLRERLAGMIVVSNDVIARATRGGSKS